MVFVVQAEEAMKSGLIDSIVAKPEDLLPAAKALALDIANGTKPKVQALKKADKLPNMMARCFWQMGSLAGHTATNSHPCHSTGAELHPGHCPR